jgi:hypothetical protein
MKPILHSLNHSLLISVITMSGLETTLAFHGR